MLPPLIEDVLVCPRVLLKEKIASFAVEDFVLPLGGPDPDNTVNGVQLRIALFQTLPVLEGQGLSMGVLNVEACAVNPPHIHPRAAEVSIYLKSSCAVANMELFARSPKMLYVNNNN